MNPNMVEGDEVSSPASQDHHSSQSNLTEEEEEEIDEGDNVSNHPSVEGVKIVDKPPNTVTEENFVPVEREFKIDDESDRKNDGGFEHDETASKSYDGGSSGDSSSSNNSSDDESHEIKSSQAVVENIPAVISEKKSLLGEKSELDMSFPANNNSVAPTIVESELKENGEKMPSSGEDKVGISDTTECIAQETDDRSSLSYNPPIASVNNGADQEKDSGISEVLSRFSCACLFVLLYQFLMN
ncbi:hypothetical protein DH2020_032692 [Rehmannia glutinosa]|uniref:Uncharacterized protein n=1 Tax=Rehmannia glutinosa TaxID=99300 RepID=A0ABR0VG48_REHGL